MPDVAVACNRCNGTGERVLTIREARTLVAVRKDWCDTRDVSEAMGRTVAATALINRLTRLADLGLIESRVHPDCRRIRQWRRL